MADTIKTNLGPVTAYADAKAHGYTGTREEFGVLLANAGLNLKAAETAKADAEAAKQAAETAQQAAAENQKNAGTQAANAKASADTAAEQAAVAKESAADAANSATAAQESETNAGLSATAAANAEAAAKQAQNAAETAKADAETAKTVAGNSADAAANSAADAKKTLESIPADYSTLSGKVDENTSGISELKEDIKDVVVKSKNLFFVEAGEIKNDGIVTVEADKKGSVINFIQDGQNTSNLYIVLKKLTLESGKKYTFSANKIDGTFKSAGALTLAIYKTSDNKLVGSINFYNILNGEKDTFTFDSDATSYYVQLTIASTGQARNYNCNINFNLTEGSDPSYLEYGFVDVNNSLPSIKKILNRKYYDLVVTKDRTGDYTSVTEAVANCNDFSTIFVKNGVYEDEIIKAWLKTVFIFGESRDGVIIKNNTGEYATPPIEMGTGMLKNLTVYAEGNATPTNKGYALHSESSVEASSCNFFILENCTFKSDYRQSWGMGMRGDTHYYARNCTFEGVYFHDCEHAYRATNQYIEFDSCNIVAKADGMALLLQDQQMSSANVNLMFNRCLVKSENGANIQYGKWTGSGIEWVSSLDDFPTWHLSTYSFGNSDNALNA